MKSTKVLAQLGACLLLAATSVHAGPPVANPEPLDIDADLTAKLLKEKSKQSTIADGMRTGRGGSSAGSAGSECGTVNINSNNNSKSNSGLKEMFGKQSTTIVTGPVINAANCK